VNSAGEKHVTFTQDQVTSTEELLLTAPGWEDSAVTESRVLILGMDDISLDALVDTELHSAETQHACYMPNMSAILNKLNGGLT
jgi:hypothetical protein